MMQVVEDCAEPGRKKLNMFEEITSVARSSIRGGYAVRGPRHERSLMLVRMACVSLTGVLSWLWLLDENYVLLIWKTIKMREKYNKIENVFHLNMYVSGFMYIHPYIYHQPEPASTLHIINFMIKNRRGTIYVGTSQPCILIFHYGNPSVSIPSMMWEATKYSSIYWKWFPFYYYRWVGW